VVRSRNQMLPTSRHLDFLDTGAVRVHGTRVGLEHLLFEYNRGVGQNELPLVFPAVTAEQASALVSYYHENRCLVDEYLDWSSKRAAELAQNLDKRPLSAVELRLREIAANRAHS